MAKTIICSIELSKTGGITVTVKNAAGNVTQTIAMDGTTTTTTVKGATSTSTVTQDAVSLELKVAGPERTSTITQKQDLVQVKCKAFVVDADTVSMTSLEKTEHAAGTTYAVKSTDDMSFTSSAKLSAASTAAMALSSTDTFTASATADAKLSGLNTTVEAMTKLTAKGGTEAAISATMMDISATAKLDIAGAITNVGKDMTTVRGSLVKLDAAAIKLG